MATLWIDTDWTLAEWEDATLTVRIAYLWEFLKGAADERQAFIEQVHSGSFDANREFPSFGEFMGFAISGADAVNNVEKIIAALNNTAGTKFDFVKTDTIKADGTTVADSARADYLDLGDILTDVLGYGDDELLIALDTNDGDDTAILKTAWTKQLFQVMNYPQYYARQIVNTTDSFFSEIQTQRMVLNVIYDLNNVLGTLLQARANYINPPNALVDLYVTNDLKETAPFSTPQEVFDYTESTYNGQLASADWETVTDVVNNSLFSTASESITLSGTSAQTDYDSGIEQRRIRFKVNENKRAQSPNTYLAALKLYFFLYKDTPTATFSDFGIGINELESKLLTLTPDGSGYYYLEPATQPDFTTFTVPAFPAAGVTNTNIEEYIQQSLNEFANTSNPILSTHRTDILVEANNSDGTAFEYFIP